VITAKPITSDACVIALRGEPNDDEVDLLAERLAELLARGTREIAVDLSGVMSNASSRLLDVLQEAAELVEEAGGALLLASREVQGTSYRLVRLRPHAPEEVRGLHASLDAAFADTPTCA
jgi:anti-anti-sigma regulatory factor